MITLLTGENSYEIEQALAGLMAVFDGEAEKLDGEGLEPRQLPDLLMGMSLFNEKRLVIIRDLSAAKPAWEALPDLIPRMSDDIHLVLIELSLDKRTKTYKALQKKAEIKDFQLWSERDSSQAKRWLKGEAKAMDLQLDEAAARELLKRSTVISAKGKPVIDQWQAKHSLEKLSGFKIISVEMIEKYIDEQPTSTVFSIFETALKGEEPSLHQLLKELEPREDPFRVFGLLSGQVFQLVALFASDVSVADTAKAIGVHPYAVSKLAPFSKNIKSGELREITAAFKEADEELKRSSAEPWVLVERALIKTARVVKPN